MNATEEYIPATNGNGHHQKVFSLTPTKDPLTQAILDARRACNGDSQLVRSARLLFVEILDRALNPSCPGFQRKGSVVIPDATLARHFGVWESTIYNWKRRLEACGYIWTAKQYRSNAWPMTVYHICALHPKPSMTSQNADGSSNAAPGRSAPDGVPGRKSGKIGNGARKPGQKSLPLPTPPVPPPVGYLTLEEAEKKRKIRGIVAVLQPGDWLSATTGTGSQPQPIPAVSHNGHRLTATIGTGSQPQPIQAHSHNGHGLSAGMERGLKRDSDKRRSLPEREGEGEPPRDLELEQFRKSLEGEFSSRLEKRKTELKGRLSQAAPEARQWFKARLAIIEEKLLGGKPPSVPKTAPVPKAKALPEPEPTAEELAAHRKFMADRERRLARGTR